MALVINQVNIRKGKNEFEVQITVNGVLSTISLPTGEKSPEDWTIGEINATSVQVLKSAFSSC